MRRAALLCATWLLAASCAVHRHGIVEPTRWGARLVTADGEVHRLVLLGDAAPVGRLDGHFVSVHGTRALGRLRVTDWAVVDGVHGMSAWSGRLAAMGSQLGIEDRRTKGFYWLDDRAARALRAHAGEVVLVEGYVDGPHRVKVLHYRLLEGPRPAATDRQR